MHASVNVEQCGFIPRTMEYAMDLFAALAFRAFSFSYHFVLELLVGREEIRGNKRHQKSFF